MKTSSLIAARFTSLCARFSFLLATLILLGSASVPTRSTVAARFTFDNTTTPATLQLLSVVSRKVHGAAGAFDINLPLSGNPGIECRFGGASNDYTLVFTFNNIMVSGAVTLTPGAGSVAPGSPTFSGSTMTVNLTNVVNAQIITITVSNATDANGEVLPDTAVKMGVLLGDSNGDGLVNASDIIRNKQQTGQVVSATNFRSDLNANGTINAADIALTKVRSGTGLPGAMIAPGSGSQSLSFNGPGTIDLGVTTALTVSVNVTFSGYSSYGLSYWIEADNVLAPLIKINNASYFTFTDPNQNTPNPAAFSSTTGTTSGFMTESRDLGSTVPSAIPQNVVPAGTYHVTDLTFCLDPNTPNGTYTLQATTVGPRFSEVTDDSGNSHQVIPAGTFTFTVTGMGSPPPPPPCGEISGIITDANGPVGGALVQACQVSAPAPGCQANNNQCSSPVTTNAMGEYHITGVPINTPLTLTVYPPFGSDDLAGYLSNLSVSSCGTPLTGQDVALQLPIPPPPGTSIVPHYPGVGVPSVNAGLSLTLTTTGCANGTASYNISGGGSTFASGPMAEMPAGSGTYTVSIPPLNPSHGAATVTMTITGCTPGGTTSFNIYIDPSGIVQDSHGALLAGATVTLLRSDTATGPFAIVPDGSAVMSPGNRHNPDVTDAQGHFGWDVLTGFYKVRAEKSGCNGIVETGALQIPPPVTDLVLTLNCPTQLTTAESVKTHGAAGNFSIPLPLSGQPGIECRTGGANGDHTIVFAFSNNVVSGNASVNSGSVAGSPAFSANTMTVNLTNIANAQTVTVTLSNVTDSFGQVLSDIVLSAGFLLADVTGNRNVNATDVSLAKSRIGQPVNQTNFRSDVSADGTINASDVLIIKSKNGTGLP